MDFTWNAECINEFLNNPELLKDIIPSALAERDRRIEELENAVDYYVYLLERIKKEVADWKI